MGALHIAESDCFVVAPVILARHDLFLPAKSIEAPSALPSTMGRDFDQKVEGEYASLNREDSNPSFDRLVRLVGPSQTVVPRRGEYRDRTTKKSNYYVFMEKKQGSPR